MAAHTTKRPGGTEVHTSSVLSRQSWVSLPPIGCVTLHFSCGSGQRTIVTPSVSYMAFTCRPQSHRHVINDTCFPFHVSLLRSGALLLICWEATELEVQEPPSHSTFELNLVLGELNDTSLASLDRHDYSLSAGVLGSNVLRNKDII